VQPSVLQPGLEETLKVENTGSGNMSHSRASEFIDGFVSVAVGLSPAHMRRINKALGLVSRNVTRRGKRMAPSRHRGCSVQEV